MRGSDGSKSRRPFLARPFWRDYVVGAVLIGVGFMVNDYAAITRGSGGWVLRIAALTLMGTGTVFLLCAIGWSLRNGSRR